jgi:hypothetical protein
VRTPLALTLVAGSHAKARGHGCTRYFSGSMASPEDLKEKEICMYTAMYMHVLTPGTREPRRLTMDGGRSGRPATGWRLLRASIYRSCCNIVKEVRLSLTTFHVLMTRPV